MRLYRIKDWERHYEVSDSKKTAGPLQWVAVRTKTDGFGYLRITRETHRTELLAAWYLMLGIAAKQPRGERGKLSRDGVPLTPDDMELLTRFPAEIFRKALEFFSDKQQGWLEFEDHPDSSGEDRTASGRNRTPSESSGPTVHTVHTVHIATPPDNPEDRGKEETEEGRRAKGRKRNPLFDALAGFEGLAPDCINEAEGGRIAKALKLIKQSTPDVTPEEIAARGASYLREYNVKPTAMGLAANWGKFGAKPGEIEGLW